MIITHILKDCVTEKDGESYCPSRIMLMLGVLSFIALSCLAVYLGQKFSAMDWGTGFGSLLGGGGAGIWAKGKSE